MRDKSISSRWRSRRLNPAINSAGLAWGAPNFQPSPQVDARRSAFWLIFTNKRYSLANLIKFANIWLIVINKRYCSTKQANNLTSFQTNQIENSWCCLEASICAPPDHLVAVDALWSLESPDA
jgi:hypothetical protein